MTKIVGLTGGIGSGKTTVAKYFEELGVPVYYADEEAKNILNYSGTVVKLVKSFGETIAPNGVPDRKKIAAIVFNDKEKLAVLNNIIHPQVAEHFKKWVVNHNHYNYVIKEAAILFESGSYKDCDKVIVVTAPRDIRINRVVARDNTTRKAVLERMAHQWDESEKIAHADFVIYNTNWEASKNEVNKINRELIA